jgi:isopentenyldiphosphate isomerase
MEFFDIRNPDGSLTGRVKERDLVHRDGDLHGTVHIFIIRKGPEGPEILLQKRSSCKDSFPGCYDISSAGHIPAGDDYRESAVRELREELGISANESDLIYCGDKYITWDDEFFGKPYHDRQYTRVFMLWADIDEAGFTLQEEEVDSVLWMDLEECIKGVKENSFLNCIDIEELMMVWRTAEDDRRVSGER